AFEGWVKAGRLFCYFGDLSGYLYAAEAAANYHDCEQPLSTQWIGFHRSLFKSHDEIVAKVDRISQRFDWVSIRREARDQIHVDCRAASQNQMIISQRCAFAACADIAHEILLQVDAGNLRRQPRRAPNHLAAHYNYVQRRDRPPNRFREHRGKDEVILAAYEHNLDIGRQLPLKMLRDCHAPEPAADDYYSSGTHALTPGLLELLIQ